MKIKTAREILDQTNAIARIIYSNMGYETPEGTEFHTETVNRHPQERACWRSACEIQLLMTETDIVDVLEELEELEEPGNQV